MLSWRKGWNPAVVKWQRNDCLGVWGDSFLSQKWLHDRWGYSYFTFVWTLPHYPALNPRFSFIYLFIFIYYYYFWWIILVYFQPGHRFLLASPLTMKTFCRTLKSCSCNPLVENHHTDSPFVMKTHRAWLETALPRELFNAHTQRCSCSC